MSSNQMPEAIELLKTFCEFAFVVGSYGTERFKPESDIDIAVFYKNDTSVENKETCWRSLEVIFSREVDLIELNQIDSIFSRQVLETGRLILNQNPGLLLQWKASQISRYIDFKMDRQIIEQNLLNRKKYV